MNIRPMMRIAGSRPHLLPTPRLSEPGLHRDCTGIAFSILWFRLVCLATLLIWATSTAAETVTATVAAGTNPFDIAVNPVTNKIYVANGNSANVTVIDEQKVQAIPLTVTIGALANHLTASTTPTFNLRSGGTLSARHVYYQVDTWTGPWLLASGSAPAFTGATGTLTGGTTHVLYGFATDGEDATSVNAGTILGFAASWRP